MIKKYIVRDNINNNHIYGEPTGLWAAPFDRKNYGCNTYKEAVEKVKRIVEKNPSFAEHLYITETVYADEKRQNQDFHITSNIRWSAWFDGYENLGKD